MRSRSNLLTTASRPNFDGIRLQIEYVHSDEVKITRRRLKKLNQALIKKRAAGIDRHGFIIPLPVDDAMALVMDDEALAAARLLGLSHVPVIRIRHLTEEQIQIFRLLQAKLAAEEELDEESITLIFEELRMENPEIDLSDSGFSIGEIDALAGRKRTLALNDLDDTSEPPPEADAVIRRGDLWVRERHRVLCGDSTNPLDIERLVGGATITQVIADAPYNLPTRSFSKSGLHGDFEAGAGEMSDEEFIRFLRRFFTAALPHLDDGALVYTFMDWRHIVELILAAKAAGLSYKQLLVWVKSETSGGMGSFYRSGHELVGVFKHGSAPSRNNIELGKHGRNRSNVLSYPGVMGSGGRKKALKMHPTVKNTALIADLLLDASAPGDAILDGFGGSGTTMIAAEKMDRVAYLCELSPGYVDVAVQRFNALGGAQAVLAGTGQTYAEVAAERQAHSSSEGEA